VKKAFDLCGELGEDTDIKQGPGMDRIHAIRNRQTARLLDHLEKKGNLTPELRTDILRSFGFIFEDVITAIKQGEGKDEGQITR